MVAFRQAGDDAGSSEGEVRFFVDILKIIHDGLKGWQVRPPGASDELIDSLAAAAPILLPCEYLDLRRFSNGAEGELGVDPGWFMFWPAEKVLDYNHAYNLPEGLPGFFGFGSNGGLELFAFDVRLDSPWPVVMVDLNTLDAAEARILAPDFASFLRALGHVYQSPAE